MPGEQDECRSPGMFFRIFERKQVHLPETYGIMVARRGIIQRQYDGLQNRSREFESLFPCSEKAEQPQEGRSVFSIQLL